MHPELIRAEIKMRGKTLTDVARLYDVSPRWSALLCINRVYRAKKSLPPFLIGLYMSYFPDGGQRTADVSARATAICMKRLRYENLFLVG